MNRPGRRRLAILVVIACAAGWLCAGRPLIAGGQRAAGAAPVLSDSEFWRLTEDLSEPNGFFNSDNLLSNETTFQYVIPKLTSSVRPGMAYLGVGPEQNFTYIVALQPSIAFIPDIRRGNLQEHLMYKALFEMAADRADFLSRLFSRERPGRLSADTTVEALMTAYARAAPNEALYQRNLAAIREWLTGHHQFKLPTGDLEGIESIYAAFYAGGPSLSYNSARPQRSRYPTYSELQQETDGDGRARGYLASEGNFKVVKGFEERNLIVPLVGDFAGPKTIRAVGGWLKQHGETVGAFYTSNVENYLFQSNVWGSFARNAAALPIDASSTFIRSCFDTCPGVPGSRSTTLLDSMSRVLDRFRLGKIRTYWDLLPTLR